MLGGTFRPRWLRSRCVFFTFSPFSSTALGDGGPTRWKDAESLKPPRHHADPEYLHWNVMWTKKIFFNKNFYYFRPLILWSLFLRAASTVSPLHTNEFRSKSAFISPVCSLSPTELA